jgi:hypothetical protein
LLVLNSNQLRKANPMKRNFRIRAFMVLMFFIMVGVNACSTSAPAAQPPPTFTLAPTLPPTAVPTTEAPTTSPTIAPTATTAASPTATETTAPPTATPLPTAVPITPGPLKAISDLVGSWHRTTKNQQNESLYFKFSEDGIWIFYAYRGEPTLPLPEAGNADGVYKLEPQSDGVVVDFTKKFEQGYQECPANYMSQWRFTGTNVRFQAEPIEASCTGEVRAFQGMWVRIAR